MKRGFPFLIWSLENCAIERRGIIESSSRSFSNPAFPIEAYFCKCSGIALLIFVISVVSFTANASLFCFFVPIFIFLLFLQFRQIIYFFICHHFSCNCIIPFIFCI